MINKDIYRQNGDEWEKWIRLLLKQVYKESFVPIPDKDRGDKGLEGFTTEGRAYQCYCPESDEMSKWKQSVQKKINDDLQKLKKNKDYFEKIFEDVPIKSWHLVVPQNISRDMLLHCKKKQKEVVGWGLPFIADNFNVTIETDASYPSERAQLQNGRAFKIHFTHSLPEEKDVAHEMSAMDSDFFSNLKRKAGILVGEDVSHQETWMNGIVRDHINGQNHMDTLRIKYPELYSDVISARSQRESYLYKNLARDSAPGDLLDRVTCEYKDDLLDILPDVSKQLIDAIVGEAISDWLIICNLDFKNKER